MRGVKIGARAIVAAGSIVTQDVAPDTIVAGNPAVTVKSIL
jgi:acetyltransferase-like isoleucine patch superfamily enzyme